jgi:hypothetical protein
MNKYANSSKNKSMFFYIFTLVLFAVFNVQSQTVHYDSITKQKYVLVNVENTYERIVNKGYESIELFETLGNYYYDNKNFKKSKIYFDKLFGKYNLSQISKKSIDRYQTISQKLRF